jgi:gliding motility-associated-like protein
MKKPECKCPHVAGIKQLCAILVCLNLLVLNMQPVNAQDIELKNPSLEAKPLSPALPAPWYRFEQSPDMQPGAVGITKPASNGNTYVGMMASKNWTERIAQQLATPLAANKTYTLSFDLAYPPVYFSSNICSGALAIYGANAADEKGEVLWKSPVIKHEAWQSYTAVFSTTKQYAFIVLGPYMDTVCTAYRGVLLDNLSPYIREVPQLVVQAQNTCKGQNTGIASVRVKAGLPPYRYNWEPGNFEDSTVENLEKGTYKVTVTSANGAAATTFVAIGENELKTDITSSEPLCHGDENALLRMSVTGGVGPYMYSIDGGTSYQSQPTFDRLKAGAYNIEVKDAFNCVLQVSNFNIGQPALLTLTSLSADAVSCSSVRNGRLTFVAAGGTPPYTYEVQGQTPSYDNVIGALDAGEYIYQITDHNNCRISGAASITKEWRDCAVFMPNAFSPNGDGLNDIFRAKVQDAVTEFRLAVYGRWGQLVFETNNPNMGWDGAQKGMGLPAGSYLWVVTYTDSKQQPIKQQGTLVLVR